MRLAIENRAKIRAAVSFFVTVRKSSTLGCRNRYAALLRIKEWHTQGHVLGPVQKAICLPLIGYRLAEVGNGLAAADFAITTEAKAGDGQPNR